MWESDLQLPNPFANKKSNIPHGGAYINIKY